MRVRTVLLCSAVALAAAAAASYASETITCTYDARGRLIRVVHTGDVNDNLSVNTTFDDADSRKSVKTTGAPNGS